MVTRVSLSDWLAFQAGIRGFKNPRLLRDRPTDGAAWMAKICEGMGGWVICRAWVPIPLKAAKVMRVSLSDRLAFQAGTQGLPPDPCSPSCGRAAWVCNFNAGFWKLGRFTRI